MNKDRKRVLILEDNPLDAELVVNHITDLGLQLEVVVCSNRKEYEKNLETFTPDVVLSDYNIPNYSGDDARLYLQTKDPDGLIPFVLVTGVVGMSDLAKMMKIGVFDLVEKDNLDVLDSVLQRALSVAEDRKQAHKQEQLLNKVSSISRVGGWELDLLTDELTWTSVTKEIHGVAPDHEPDLETAIEFYKKGWSRELVENRVERAMAHGTPYDEQLLLVNAAGDEIWVRTMGESQMENGKCVRLFGTIQDVDRTVRLTKQAERIAERHRSVLQAARAITWDWRIPEDKVYVDDTFLELGVSQEALEKVKVQQDEDGMFISIHDIAELVHPDDRSHFQQKMTEHLQGNTPVFMVQYRAYNSSNDLLWVQNRGNVVEWGDQGEPIRMVGSIIDNTTIYNLHLEFDAQERFIKSVTDNVEGMIVRYVVYPDGSDKALYVSSGSYEVYGVTAEEALNDISVIFDLIHPDDIEGVRQKIKACTEKKEPFKHIFRAISRDGKEKWLKTTSVGNWKEDGSVVWDGITVDITEQLKDKEELRKLSLVANRSTNGVIITNADQDIEWINDGFERLTGYTLEEVKGKNARFLQGEDTREEDRAVLRDGIQNHEPAFTEILNYTKDGTPYWVEIFLTPVKDEEGNLTNYVAIENDISNRKRREEEILESRKQTEAALHELELRNLAVDKHSIVAITDTAGTIQYVNDKFCQVSGYTREQLIGADHRLISSGYHDAAFWKDMYATIASGEVWNGIIRNRAKDGTLYWLRTTITPFTDAETGKVERYIAIRTDITARIEAEQKLRKTLDNLEQLVHQKTEKLELAHQNVIESLEYAQRLQQTLVPSVQELRKVVSNAGVILRPKDIVSGDFYWFYEFQDELIFCLVDCTGHGVPGAMMSMLSGELINSLVAQKHIFRPDVVLEELDSTLVEQMMREGAKMKMSDGMDMSVVSIDRRNGLFSYAAAKSHGVYYHARTDEFQQLKPDRFSVGGIIEGLRKDFTRKRFDFAVGDRVYLFSDGIYDQFGGPHGKKLMRKRLFQYIQDTKEMAIDEQVSFIEEKFMEWMGDNPQVDDVSFVGLEL